MDFQEYYKARDQILSIMKEDLVGPVSEEETIQEPPVSYYLLGKLYPGNIKRIEDTGNVINEEDAAFEENRELLGNLMYQSALGLSFAVSASTKSFNISAKAARYFPNTESEYEWKREKINYELNISLDDIEESTKYVVADDLILYIRVHILKDVDKKHIIVSLVNSGSSDSAKYTDLSCKTFFQPELRINNILGGQIEELTYDSLQIEDLETKNLNMLYSDYKCYASGHGCGVNWILDLNKNVVELYTDVMPMYEVLQMRPSSCFDKDVLSMDYLSKNSYEKVSAKLYQSVEKYKEWIDKQGELVKTRNDIDEVAAENNLRQCKEVCARINKAVDLLKQPEIYHAFQLANEAMLLQRTKGKTTDVSAVTWYPFQLAFFLMEINSIVDPHSEERDLVDLLWFPTGGGKTEAYLGIAAFTLFYERINKNKSGVQVIMRYTLRLLSLQQFERAAAMICAAELIRKREKISGESFGIGLWVGVSVTPNTLKDVTDYLKNGKSSKISNPIQLKKCPWCGSVIYEKNYSVNKIRKRMIISCPNEKCDFHEELPIHLIDEDIYANKPSFVIGTVDKFVQIAYKEEAGNLFGCGLENGSPNLIIQDELHLISGPLGTISGLFEASISKLLENNGIKPKVIASTATIKNAKQQVLSLYGKKSMQFPPQGISADDSFFAEKADRNQKAARMYVGMLPSGSSNSTSFNRIMGSLLFASRYLMECGYSDKVIDAFWTETGYFNTLIELGSAIIRIVDNVQDRYNYLRTTKFADKYPLKKGESRYTKYFELTSRNNSSELGEFIQNELTVPYPKTAEHEPFDFVMASNMISVGVDVARLGCMLVVGQPLKTAEYIQATSRVGRTNPGLVITMYNGAKSRDRSHYEQFVSYHSSFYKYVEPTSLTPFSDRARDRALQAMYIILCRYSIDSLRGEKQAKNYRKDMDGLDDIRKYIFDYVKKVDPDELENVKNEIAEIEDLWDDRANRAENLVYYNFSRDDDSLYKDDYLEGNRFRMMNSMRSVEPSIEVCTGE